VAYDAALIASEIIMIDMPVHARTCCMSHQLDASFTQTRYGPNRIDYLHIHEARTRHGRLRSIHDRRCHIHQLFSQLWPPWNERPSSPVRKVLCTPPSLLMCHPGVVCTMVDRAGTAGSKVQLASLRTKSRHSIQRQDMNLLRSTVLTVRKSAYKDGFRSPTAGVANGPKIGARQSRSFSI
jgi:hypothetical protein